MKISASGEACSSLYVAKCLCTDANAFNMSHDGTEHTKLGPGFDILDVSGTPTTVYCNEEEMEDIATSSVKLVGETVPESDVSLLGLSPQNPITVGVLHNVTGAHTSERRSSSDAEA